MRALPGCVACDIYEEQGAQAAVVLIERWASDDELQTHLRSDLYRHILGAIELSGDRPDIRFEHVSATEGIEMIERSREQIPD